MNGCALVLGAVLLTVAPAAAAVARQGQPVMGTVLEVTIVAEEEAVARRLAAAAIAEARRWDDVLTTWRPQGELARLNAEAGNGPVAISADLASALAQMQRLSRATDGAFDPAVGPLVRLWGRPGAPGPQALAALGPLRIGEALRTDGSVVSLAVGSGIDAGGIGKGMALDSIAAMLRREGVLAAYLDFGGSSQLAIGSPPGEPGWRIAVSGLESGSLRGTTLLRDAALSTSRALGAGDEAGPIVDPRTGRPVPGPRLATAIAPDATTAEAWSTALVVLGGSGLDAARRDGVDGIVEDAGGAVRSAGFPLEGQTAGVRSSAASPRAR